MTFVPQDHTGVVLGAMSGAGGGVIGEYDHCSFRVSGTGTFRPSPAAHPAVGERGALNQVEEHRLEMVVPRQRLGALLTALREAHPYEEVAYDIYPLVEIEGRSRKGLGRVGRLPRRGDVRTIADRLAEGLPAPHLRVAGTLDRAVETVAACGGSGDSLLGAARDVGADLYVTGDLRHHAALDGLAMGMALIDAGHYATEAAALPAFRDALTSAARGRGLSARLLPSAVRTEPWAQYRFAGSERDEGAP